MNATVRSLEGVLQTPLFSIAGTPVNGITLIVSGSLALASLVAGTLADRAAVRFLQRRGVQDDGSVLATGRLVRYLVVVVGLAVAVHTLGINLAALFTAGAVLAIAIGFAMQNIAQNFVSGVILLVERTIKPGDIIEVEGRMVKVTSLGLRSTVTRTWDSEDLIIPNSNLVASTVKNFTLRDRMHRIRTPVGVSYSSDMKQVREVLERTGREIPWRHPSMDAVVLLKGFGDSSVDFELSVWVDRPFERSLSQSDLNEAVWFALKDAGITIAFPQLDVHLDDPRAGAS